MRAGKSALTPAPATYAAYSGSQPTRVGIGGHEDIAPCTARADGLRQVTAERKSERDAMDRGKIVPERRNGIQHGLHALTLTRAMHERP